MELKKIILETARVVPEIMPHLSPEARAYIHARARKAEGDLTSLNRTYHDEITEALTTYFEGGIVTGPRNRFRVATTESFYEAFNLGWQDGGGEFPVDEDAMRWLEGRINQEYGHIDQLFVRIKELRKEEGLDFFPFVTDHADGYTRTLAAIYNAGSMWAQKDMVCGWRLGKTEKHCSTCSQLNGEFHKLSWYIARNYIPRQPGASMECGGYYCDCELYNKHTGDTVTI